MPIKIRPIDSDGNFISEEAIEIDIDDMSEELDDEDDYDNNYGQYWEEARAAFEAAFVFPVAGYKVFEVSDGDIHPDARELAKLIDFDKEPIWLIMKATHIACRESSISAAAIAYELEMEGEALADALDADADLFVEGTAAAHAEETYGPEVPGAVEDFVDWSGVADAEGYIDYHFNGTDYVKI